MRRVGLLTLAAFLVGCQDSPTVVDLTPFDGGPSLDISDGAHGGNQHFFFLPPMVPQPKPKPSGEFLDDLNPLVVISCVLECPDDLQGFPLEFTRQNGPGREGSG